MKFNPKQFSTLHNTSSTAEILCFYSLKSDEIEFIMIVVILLQGHRIPGPGHVSPVLPGSSPCPGSGPDMQTLTLPSSPMHTDNYNEKCKLFSSFGLINVCYHYWYSYTMMICTIFTLCIQIFDFFIFQL